MLNEDMLRNVRYTHHSPVHSFSHSLTANSTSANVLSAHSEGWDVAVSKECSMCK